jgi:hypothetical protein
MNRNIVLKIWRVGVVLMLVAMMMGSMPAKAQNIPEEPMAVESNVALADAPILEEPVLYDSPPPLTEEQTINLAWGEENANRSIDVDTSLVTEIASPVPGTESVGGEMRPRSGAPLAPGDQQTYIWKEFGSTIPAGYKSNTMESSTDGKGQKMFYTGNWFAASSVNKGRNWTYVDAFNGYADFCCDQVILHDVNRDIYLWLRMASPNGSGENTFKLSVDFNRHSTHPIRLTPSRPPVSMAPGLTCGSITRTCSWALTTCTSRGISLIKPAISNIRSCCASRWTLWLLLQASVTITIPTPLGSPSYRYPGLTM